MIKIKRENAGEISAETGISKSEGHSSCPREKVNEPENGLPLLFMSFSLSIVNAPVFFYTPVCPFIASRRDGGKGFPIDQPCPFPW
jgi:hypothetical protein